MKILLTHFLFFVSISFATSQVSIAPECLLLEGTNVDEIKINIDITNLGDEETLAYWTFEPASDFPEDWNFQICDLGLCYAFGTDTSSLSQFLLNRIPAGETKVFSLGAQNKANTPYDTYPISGSSYGTLRLYNNENFIDPMATSNCMVSNNNIEIEDLIIYPNPTTDVFQLKNDASIYSITIYNIVGRKISTLNHSPGKVHDVSTLRSGMYLIKLVNEKDEVVKNMRLSKR
jgi:hypothetical protein